MGEDQRRVRQPVAHMVLEQEGELKHALLEGVEAAKQARVPRSGKAATARSGAEGSRSSSRLVGAKNLRDDRTWTTKTRPVIVLSQRPTTLLITTSVERCPSNFIARRSLHQEAVTTHETSSLR